MNDQVPAHRKDQHGVAAAKPRRARASAAARPKALAGRPRSRRWHRGPKGATVIDLIFKIDSSDGWSATLRNDPSVVLVADNGDDLAQLTRELALALLQGRRAETLRSMRLAGAVLPAADNRQNRTEDNRDVPGWSGRVRERPALPG
jgi:hypothetical protein